MSVAGESDRLPSTARELRVRLDEARAALVEALTGLGERDFAADVGGITVTQLLAELAAAEHEALRRARVAAGLEARPEISAGAATSRPLPPQVTHALAGTRHEARVLLDELGETAVPPEVARLLLDGAAAREYEVAALIAARTVEGNH